ncbi:phage tail tape measure protein [Reyranella sp.]|uniref:phage tail tape measure protein n=1 Tax=Reyranella sp. TaxID=1929291 RepID=UPI0027291B65|nr:phage tail tape measure protein [Reyranella sp.]MDO8974328.1 phage tail tape measure protein [Reyranella sp.]
MADETKIIRIVVDSSKAVDGSAAATRALERMERAQGSAVSSLDRMERGLGKIGGLLKAHLALAIADIGARLVQMGKHAFDAAAGLDELADQIGVSNKFLQASQFLAAQNGVKLEQLETAYGKFNQKMGEAADGSKEMVEALQKLGVKNLDLAGKLRPTEDIMEDVAAAIAGIDDPARRAAAAVEFFGKSGTKLLPMMAEIGNGADAMAAKMIKAGAYIGPETSKRLDEMADAAERASFRWRAAFANMISAVADWYERNRTLVNLVTLGLAGMVELIAKDPQKITGAIGDAYDAAIRKAGDWIDVTKSAFDSVIIAGARFAAGFGEAIRSIPGFLKKAFIDGMNDAIEAIEKGLNIINRTMVEQAPWTSKKLGITPDPVKFGRLDGGGASTADRNAGIRAAEDKAEADMRGRGYGREYKADREAQRKIDFDDWFAKQEAGATGYVPPKTTGGGFSTVKGSGDAEADRMRKALGDAARELEQARAFAGAANQGADAVARLEIHFRALKAAQDVFGKTADDNTKGVADLTAKLEGQALVTQKLKNLGDFRIGTQTLRDQNELLEAELRLAGELPAIRERELATLKVMQEVRAKGLSDNKQDIDDRIALMETNEHLKTQAEEIKRSNELWMEPLKTALSSIQTTAADAFENMLNSGKLHFEELGQVFKKMVIRMAAEFLALATVRPVMSVLVNAVSPNMASVMGLGGGTSMPGLGGGSGGGLFGGSGFSMPSTGGGLGRYGEVLESSSSSSSSGGLIGGGLSNMFSGASSFLQRPMASLFSSAAPAGGYADVGALLSSGSTGASASASGIGGIGGMSIGAGLGSALGIGMGAYQAITSKSLGGTLGGIGSMIGSGMMLIPGMQIPGMIVTALSAILPSLIGEPNARTHSSTNASLHYGNGNWYTTGGAYGPNANSGQSESALRGLTGGIDSVLGILGGVKDPSKVWGLNASSWTAQGKDWSYTSNATHLVDPETGSQEAWRMNMDDMMDTGAAQVAIRSILSGAVGETSATMKTALESMRAASMGIKETAESIVFVDDVYELLGKGALTVRTQFRELEKQFDDMTDKATRLGLALAPIEAEQKKATERLGQDYVDNLIDPIAASLRAWEDEKQSILANIDYIKQHTDVVVDNARITEALLRREAALKEQLYGGAISQLEDAIRRLSLGDLANLSPTTMLTGVRAAYQATVAQARSGDSSAIARVAAEGTTFAQAAQSYYASGPDYEALKQQILDDLLTIQSQLQGSGGSANNPAPNDNNGATQVAVAQVVQLQTVVSEQSRQIAALMAKLSETNDLLLRRVVNG